MITYLPPPQLPPYVTATLTWVETEMDRLLGLKGSGQ